MASKVVNPRPVILWTGAAVILAMTFGSGMRMKTKELKDRLHEWQVARQDLRVTQQELQGREALLQQLEARRLAELAHKAFAQNDPTTAQKQIAEAVTRLQTAQRVNAAGMARMEKAIAVLQKMQTRAGGTGAGCLEAISEMDTALAAAKIPEPDRISPITVPPPTANDIPEQALGNDVAAYRGH